MPAVDQRGAGLNLACNVGDDFTLSVTVTENAATWSATGATVASTITTVTGAAAGVTSFTTAVSDGVLTASLTDAQTTTLGAGTYRYAIEVTKSSVTRTWLAGTFTVSGATTPGRTSSSASLSITTGDVTLATTTGTTTAANITVADAAGYYAGTTVETVLAELQGPRIRKVEAFHNFRDDADGDLTVMDSGQTWLIGYNTVNANNKPTVSSGAYVVPNVGAAQAAAGYAQVLLDDEVRRIGCDVTFSSYSTNNGVVALAIWKDFPVAASNGLTIPYSPLHLTVGPSGWTIGYWETPNGQTLLGSGSFGTPLTADDSTVHRIEAEIIDTTIYLYLPTGEVYTFTDPKVATYAGRYACWEPYRFAASTDSRARVLGVWASSEVANTGETPVTVPQLVKGIRWLSTRPIVQAAGTTDGSSITLSGVSQDIPGLSITTARVGATGKILVESELYVSNSSGLLLVTHTVNGSAANFSAVSGAFTGRIRVCQVGTIATAADFTVTVGAWNAGGSGSVLRSVASGQAGSVKVTAI